MSERSYRLQTLGLFVGMAVLVTGSALGIAAADPPSPKAAAEERDLEAGTEDLRGESGSEELRAQGQVPNSKTRADAAQVGVMTYRSSAGLTCLSAGPVQAGRVGRIGRDGFRALRANEAPGMCGDFTENLASFGGIALGHTSASAADSSKVQSIVYGIVADEKTKVRVIWPNGSEAAVPVSPASGPALPGVSGVFVAAAEVGIGTDGVQVELVDARGALLHSFQL